MDRELNGLVRDLLDQQEGIAAIEVVRQLARAKHQLARELEANLKQLREVLKETERIAGDMESVLKEAQSPTAGRGNGGKHEQSQRRPDPEQGDFRRGAEPLRGGDDRPEEPRAAGRFRPARRARPVGGNDHPAEAGYDGAPGGRGRSEGDQDSGGRNPQQLH